MQNNITKSREVGNLRTDMKEELYGKETVVHLHCPELTLRFDFFSKT